jgi:hypothetical protein
MGVNPSKNVKMGSRIERECSRASRQKSKIKTFREKSKDSLKLDFEEFNIRSAKKMAPSTKKESQKIVFWR